MFCSKCGAQNADGSPFCGNCGAPLAADAASPVQTANPVQPEIPPVQPGFNAGQPTYGQQPAAYGQPVYAQPAAAKKSKAVPIIIAACSAVVVAFVIILFTVIIPNSGIKGKLRHKWSITESGITVTYDFKKNEASSFGISFPITWEIVGEDHLKIGMSVLGETNSEEFIFSISADGKSLTLTDVNNPSSKEVFTRVN